MERQNLIQRLVARKLHPAANRKAICGTNRRICRGCRCACRHGAGGAGAGRNALCGVGAQPKK